MTITLFISFQFNHFTDTESLTCGNITSTKAADRSFHVSSVSNNDKMTWLFHHWLAFVGISLFVFKGKVSYLVVFSTTQMTR